MQNSQSPDGVAERVHRLIDPWVASRPHATALAEAERRLSYGELATAAAAAADRLAEAGLRAGDRLLVVCENGIAAVVLALAASRLDAWVCLVNARLSPREVDLFAAHCGARRVAYASAGSAEAAGHADRAAAAPVDWPGAGPFRLGPLNADAVAEPVHAGGDRQVAALVYTSGTSGNPKGVMLTHRNLCFVAGNNRVNRRMTPEDKVYGVLPISHVYGLASITVSTLHSGGCLVLEPRFDPGRVARALAEDGITILHGVPAMYAKLLEWGRRPGNRLAAPRLRVAQGGGAPLDQNFKDEFEATFGLPLHNGYGMTESSPSIAQTRLDAPRRDCAVGPPIPGLEIRIVKEGVGVAPGEVGELHVRGPNVMAGYYRAPELTREAVDAEGWLNTGDLARQAPDGALYIVGRAKELIIRSGFNVYPVEVEQVINGHPEVVHSAVVGRHVPGNEEVVAYVEPVPGSRLTAGELAAWLAGVLSPYKRPSEIVILDHLPATATGKILKNALRQMAARGAD